jgi:hypothetical protein
VNSYYVIDAGDQKESMKLNYEIDQLKEVECWVQLGRDDNTGKQAGSA